MSKPDPYPTFPYPSPNHLPRNLSEAIHATPPGRNFADRDLLNVIRTGLNRIYSDHNRDGDPRMREAARQALARLEGRTSLSDECECCINNECECVADDEEDEEDEEEEEEAQS